MNTKQALIQHIAQRLNAFGYTVYIAERGEYGFYTDGVRVVSFGGSWSTMVDFTGNYITSAPRATGTGWGIPGGKELCDITEEQARAFIKSNAPDWATRGASSVRYTTPEQYLKTYNPSSRYALYAPQA